MEWTLTSPNWFQQTQHLIDFMTIHSPQLGDDERQAVSPYQPSTTRRRILTSSSDKQNAKTINDKLLVYANGIAVSQLIKSDMSRASTEDTASLLSKYKCRGWCLVFRKEPSRRSSSSSSRKPEQQTPLWIVHVSKLHSANAIDKVASSAIRRIGMAGGDKKRVIFELTKQWLMHQYVLFHDLTLSSMRKNVSSLDRSDDQSILKWMGKYDLDDGHSLVRLGKLLKSSSAKQHQDDMEAHHGLQAYLPWWWTTFSVSRRIRRPMRDAMFKSIKHWLGKRH